MIKFIEMHRWLDDNGYLAPTGVKAAQTTAGQLSAQLVKQFGDQEFSPGAQHLLYKTFPDQMKRLESQ